MRHSCVIRLFHIVEYFFSEDSNSWMWLNGWGLNSSSWSLTHSHTWHLGWADFSTDLNWNCLVELQALLLCFLDFLSAWLHHCSRTSHLVAQVSMKQSWGLMALSLLASEVTKSQLCCALLVKVVTSLHRLKRREHKLYLSMGGALKNYQLYFKITSGLQQLHICRTN